MEWRKRRKPPEFTCVIVFSVFYLFIIIEGIPISEESDDVNVVSIENLDILLKLRMANDALNETAWRLKNKSRRWILNNNNNKYSGVGLSQTSPLCTRYSNECVCNSTRYLSVSCNFTQNQVVEISPGSLPTNLIELSIVNARQVNITSGAFLNHNYLGKVSFQNIKTLLISSYSFQNLTTAIFQIEIRDCSTVVLDEYSFTQKKGPISALISSSEHVIMNSFIFSWLSEMTIQNVPHLKLSENSFSFESAKIRRHGPAALVIFNNVTLYSLPAVTFPSPMSEIRFKDCHIKRVSKDSFSAIQISSIYFLNTSLDYIENGAFNEGTLVLDMEFNGAQVGTIANNVLSAVTNLTILNSKITNISKSSFNITVATVTITNNYFYQIKRHSFQFNEWNKVLINSNRIENLEPDSFTVPFKPVPHVDKYEFIFTDNTFSKLEAGSLSFIITNAEVNTIVNTNKFERPCHCHMVNWLRSLTSSSSKYEWLYNSSYCVVDVLLARCFNVQQGYISIKNFTEQVCGTEEYITCEEANHRGSFNANIFNDIETAIDREKKLLRLIFLVVVGCMCCILTITGFIWLRKKGVFGDVINLITPSPCMSIISRMFNRSSLVSTLSISRVNIHEYAEIQNQLNQQHRIILNEEDDDEMISYEDKATQTLPEELTQELLQSLREKLDDPDNYNEARDMIEHLYDLIKVEENCNTNESPRTSILFEEDDDGIYDIIQPKKTINRPRRKHKDVVSIGTRAPSPDKLLPLNYVVIREPPTVICDYTEPRDRQPHIYMELPGSQVPDVVPSEIKGLTMANRPLPNKPDQASTSFI